MTLGKGGRWLLLIHQIPPRPGYLRVKIGRRMQAVGAVAVKNSVYVLPRSAAALEDLQWIRREIVDGKGEATICEASFVEGLSNASVEELFRTARAADYEALGREARRLRGAATSRPSATRPPSDRASAALLRLRKRLTEVAAIDFFDAPGRSAVEEALTALESGLRPAATAPVTAALDPSDYRGRRWVTRAGVHVDRIASAWLIRRFIDPRATFAFLSDAAAAPVAGEVRFDMFEAEFTHEGEQCTFEVLARRFALADQALRRVGEIVHDIDLKDARFARPETAGVERLLAGLAHREADDAARLREGGALFESLYESFRGDAVADRSSSRPSSSTKTRKRAAGRRGGRPRGSSRG